MTRTRNTDLANTRLLWRFTEQPRPTTRTRRRAVRRQAEPVRPIYDHAVPWPITIGEQRSSLRAFLARYEHVIAVLVIVAIIVVAIYATGHSVEPFRPFVP